MEATMLAIQESGGAKDDNAARWERRRPPAPCRPKPA